MEKNGWMKNNSKVMKKKSEEKKKKKKLRERLEKDSCQSVMVQ
jgi:hypothetical protein